MSLARQGTAEHLRASDASRRGLQHNTSPLRDSLACIETHDLG